MRSLLLVAATVSLVPSVRDADACGDMPAPQVLVLARHAERGADRALRSRTFALIAGEKVPVDAPFRLLAPESYDWTHLAEAGTLAEPMALTLVGPGGAVEVETAHHVFLQEMPRVPPHGAVEVKAGVADYRIALRGKNLKAAWFDIDGAVATEADVQWLRMGYVNTKLENVHVARVHGSEIELVTVVRNDSVTTMARSKTGDLLGTAKGWPVGGFSTWWMKALVVEENGVATTIAI